MISAAAAIAAATISVAVPTGTFTTSISNADLAAGHVTGSAVAANRGTYTLKIQAGGRWTMKNTAPGHLINPTQGGTYHATGTSVAFTNIFTGGTLTARLALRAGTLRFTILKASRPELRVVFGAHPWRKVG
jgi:hypothetical protein